MIHLALNQGRSRELATWILPSLFLAGICLTNYTPAAVLFSEINFTPHTPRGREFRLAMHDTPAAHPSIPCANTCHAEFMA